MPSDAIDERTVIHVGDVVEVDMGRPVEREIGHLTVCLRPEHDPIGVVHGVEVQSCEWGLPFVIDPLGVPTHLIRKRQIMRIVRRWDEEEDSDA